MYVHVWGQGRENYSLPGYYPSTTSSIPASQHNPSSTWPLTTMLTMQGCAFTCRYGSISILLRLRIFPSSTKYKIHYKRQGLTLHFRMGATSQGQRERTNILNYSQLIREVCTNDIKCALF